MADDHVNLIATLPKNAREELRISLAEFQGYDLIALRVYYDPKDGGDKRPGKAGINLRVAMLPDLIAALQRAQAEAERLDRRAA